MKRIFFAIFVVIVGCVTVTAQAQVQPRDTTLVVPVTEDHRVLVPWTVKGAVATDHVWSATNRTLGAGDYRQERNMLRAVLDEAGQGYSVSAEGMALGARRLRFQLFSDGFAGVRISSYVDGEWKYLAEFGLDKYGYTPQLYDGVELTGIAIARNRWDESAGISGMKSRWLELSFPAAEMLRVESFKRDGFGAAGIVIDQLLGASFTIPEDQAGRTVLTFGQARELWDLPLVLSSAQLEQVFVVKVGDHLVLFIPDRNAQNPVGLVLLDPLLIRQYLRLVREPFASVNQRFQGVTLALGIATRRAGANFSDQTPIGAFRVNGAPVEIGHGVFHDTDGQEIRITGATTLGQLDGVVRRVARAFHTTNPNWKQRNLQERWNLFLLQYALVEGRYYSGPSFQAVQELERYLADELGLIY